MSLDLTTVYGVRRYLDGGYMGVHTDKQGGIACMKVVSQQMH
jgi:hypothetical protein